MACITDKIREARLRYMYSTEYGHAMRREDGNCIKRIMMAEVNGHRIVEDDRRNDGET